MATRTPMDTRTGADFRMLRNKLGVSQKWVADKVGVTRLTIITWEDPREFALPSRKAWDLLENMWREADRMATGQVDIAMQAAKIARDDKREPTTMLLPYWYNPAYYKASHRDGCMEVENLATRMVQDRLAVLGLPCGIIYAEPVA